MHGCLSGNLASDLCAPFWRATLFWDLGDISNRDTEELDLPSLRPVKISTVQIEMASRAGELGFDGVVSPKKPLLHLRSSAYPQAEVLVSFLSLSFALSLRVYPIGLGALLDARIVHTVESLRTPLDASEFGAGKSDLPCMR